MTRIFVVEPYFAGSHRSWADGYQRHSAHEVHVISHEGNFWRWRLRGAAVTLAEATAQLVTEVGSPDVLLVSDFVNLASYLGLVRRSVGDPAVALYMHENQLSYPLGANQQPDEALALINWVSMVAADQVFINSAFHRDELFAELPKLLSRAPDLSHTRLLDEVRQKTAVLPVGIELDDITERGSKVGSAPVVEIDDARPLVLWSHRWDHDKNPRAVFNALFRLADEGIAFRLAIAGENERVDPREFVDAQARLGDRVVHAGYLSRAEYCNLLTSADVVPSAALHEFFGIAMIEAMVAGAVPVLPARLSYPEVVPPRYHEAALYDDGQLTDRLRDVLLHLDQYRLRLRGLSDELRVHDWSIVAPRYDRELSELVR